MAESAKVRIESREQFEAWLDIMRPSRALVLALAARAALRALPLTAGVAPRTGDEIAAKRFGRLIALLFRATASAWAAGLFPTRARDFHPAEAVDAINAGFGDTAAIVGERAVVMVAEAARTAALAAAIDDALGATRAAARAVEMANECARTAAFAAGADAEAAAAAYWYALSVDAQRINEGTGSGDLADEPLWPNRVPTIAKESWPVLVAALPANDGWRVWIQWYEARLRGESWYETREIAFASAPDSRWEEGPAAANAWILKILEILDEAVASAPPLERLPQPLSNVPSLFAFGENKAGQIDIVSGPQNTPAISFAGDEDTHHQWLDVARELARRLADDLKAGKYGNLRSDYFEGLDRYASDLPAKPGEGNFMLADAEIIALLDLFGAEAGILPDAFAARLNRVLNGHFALLDFYPVARRYHEAARKGRLSPPLPQGAFAGFANVVQKNSPSTFAPRVTQGLAEAAREAPKVELDEVDRAVHAAIAPAKYPYEYDGDVERRFGKAGTANALYKAVLDRLKDPEKAEAMLNIVKDLSPYVQEIIEWLQKVVSG